MTNGAINASQSRAYDFDSADWSGIYHYVKLPTRLLWRMVQKQKITRGDCWRWLSTWSVLSVDNVPQRCWVPQSLWRDLIEIACIPTRQGVSQFFSLVSAPNCWSNGRLLSRSCYSKRKVDSQWFPWFICLTPRPNCSITIDPIRDSITITNAINQCPNEVSERWLESKGNKHERCSNCAIHFPARKKSENQFWNSWLPLPCQRRPMCGFECFYSLLSDWKFTPSLMAEIAKQIPLQ